MKKFLSIALSLVLLLSAAFVAIPLTVSADASATPIKATPVITTGKGTGNWQYTSIAEVMPLQLTVAKGIKVSAKAAEGYTYDTVTDAYSTLRTYVSAPEGGTWFTSDTVMLYVDLPSANEFYFQYYSGATRKLKAGTTVSLLQIDGSEWTTATVTDRSSIEFGQSFKGYIKFSLSTNLGVNTSTKPDYFQMAVKSLGGAAGSVTYGPLFSVTEDSNSTVIEVPEEYRPAPIEAVPVITTGKGTGNWQYTTITEVAPLGITKAKCIQVSAVSTEGYTFDTAVAAYNNLRTYISAPEGGTWFTSDTVMLYIDLPSANEFYFQYYSGATRNLLANTEVSVLEIDGNAWSTKTVNANNALDFDKAFRGYIKFSLATNLGVNASTNPDYFQMCVKSLGGAAGSVTYGPLFSVTKDSNSTKITVPEEYKADPIEATPVTDITLHNAYGSTLSASLVNPLGFVNASGVKLTAITDYVGDESVNSHNWYDSYVTVNGAKVIDSETALLFYVKFDSANIIVPKVGTRWGYVATPKLGATYYFAEKGAEEWSKGTVVKAGAGEAGSNYHGALRFDSAFEGYIKINLSDLGHNEISSIKTGYEFSYIKIGFKGLGGDYGDSMITGPFFLVDKDSSSTEIKIDDSYKPEPMKVNAITDFTTMGYSWNYTSSSEVAPLDFTSAKGVKLTTYQWLEGGKYELPEGAAMKTAKSFACSVMNQPYDIVGTEGILMYLKTSGPQTVLPMFNISSNSKVVETAMATGAAFKYAAKGEQSWTDGAAVFGGAEGDTTNKNVGAICFDKAFEGYVYIPLTSLVNASGTAVSTFTTALITRIDARIKGTGGAYGDEVIAGPYFSATADSVLAELSMNDLLGDINRDSLVNEADVTVLRRYILGTSNAFVVANGNINKDGEGLIDILDLVVVDDYADNTVYAADVYYKSNGALNIEGGVRSFSTFVYLPDTFNTASTRRAGVILGNYSGSGNCLNVEIKNNGNPRIYHIGNNGSLDWVVDANIQTGDFAHLVFTIDAEGNGVCYINGEVAGTKSGITTFDPLGINAEFVIGGDNRSGNTNFFKGKIQEIAVYSDVLTPDEVAAISNAGTAKGTDGLDAFYDLSGTASGSSVVDMVGTNAKFEPYTTFFNDSELAPYEYSFAVVGDTQSLTRSYSGDFPKIYDWLLANKDSRKIAHVFVLGDITDGDTDAEWALAKTHISKLDGEIPYSLIRGNHDSPEKMDQYFANEAYMSQFGGFYDDGDDSTYEGKIANSWRTFTVGGTDYLFMTLDFMRKDLIGEDNGLPNTKLSVEKQNEILAWAKEIIDAHPEHKVIISTHNYVQANCSITQSHAIESELVAKCPNVYMVFGGHISSDTIVVNKTTYDAGHTVTSFLVDPQQSDLNFGGLGMVAMLYFHADGSVSVQYYSTIRNQYFIRANQFTLN